MGDVYPELRDSRDVITRIVAMEEKLYSSTVGAGLTLLDEVMKRATAAGSQIVSGPDAFRLYDTYGLRYDLIEYVADQKGFSVDSVGFEAELEKQRQRARESWKGGAAKQVNPVYQGLATAGRSEFTGYLSTRLAGAKITAVLRDGQLVDKLSCGEEGEVVLDRTPFYAESGGQVGDVGVLETDESHLLVKDTVSPASGVIVHRVVVELGEVHVGDTVEAQVDSEKRARTMANHTATHLLHAALRGGSRTARQAGGFAGGTRSSALRLCSLRAIVRRRDRSHRKTGQRRDLEESIAGQTRNVARRGARHRSDGAFWREIH
jgi:alanyl-tRNA synthetase